MWCASCAHRATSTLTRLTGASEARFRPGTSIIDLVHPRVPLIAVPSSMEHLSFFPLNQAEAAQVAHKERANSDGKELTVSSFIVMWIMTLTWVTYLSPQGSYPKAIPLVVMGLYALLLWIWLPRLTRLAWYSIQTRQVSVESLICLELLSVVTLSAHSIFSSCPEILYIDSAAMSLLIVQWARFFTQNLLLTQSLASLHLSHEYTTQEIAPTLTVEKQVKRVFALVSLYAGVLFVTSAFTSNIESTIPFLIILPIVTCPCLLWSFLQWLEGTPQRLWNRTTIGLIATAAMATYNSLMVSLAFVGSLSPMLLSIGMFALLGFFLCLLVCSQGRMAARQ